MDPDAPPRVLHAAQPVDGGVARAVAQAAVDQVARGWDVTVACPDGPLADDLAAAGVPRLHWDARPARRASTPAQVGGFAALVLRSDPEVVHLHSISAGMTGRLAVRGRRPTLFQPHGWSWQSVDGPLARAMTGWERLAARWTRLAICVSEAERRNGRSAGLRLPMEVVRNGVDTDVFRPCDSGAARRSLGLSDAPHALFVGRLDVQKGAEVLVRAWPRLRARVPDAVLLVVGDGARGQALRVLAGALGVHDAVRFVGPQADVRPWYAAADVVAFSSRWGEGMPLVPLEAQAAGRPVVASDVTGVAEVLGAGRGAVVPAGDEAAFARELGLRLGDRPLAAAEGRAARRHAVRELDSRTTLASLAALTASLCARSVS